MNNRSTGLIATIASAVLCGCPGLLMCVFGAFVAAGVPVTTELNGITQTGRAPAYIGVLLLCASLLLILIPVVIGVVTLRKKPADTPISNEPLPPAS